MSEYTTDYVVVPAYSGFHVVGVIRPGHSEVDELWEEPVVMWRIESKGVVHPITPSGWIPVLAHGYGVRYPDGKVWFEGRVIDDGKCDFGWQERLITVLRAKQQAKSVRAKLKTV